MKKSLFIFRRDLRLDDNIGLISALKNSDKVIPCFIFDPRQKENDYFSETAFSFMIDCLLDLDNKLRKKKTHLYIFKGLPHEIVEYLIKEEKINSVYINRDYTPFSKERDKKIKEICEKYNVNFFDYQDYALNEKIYTKQGNPYTIFTPYLKYVFNLPVKRPISNNFNNYYNEEIKREEKDVEKNIIGDIKKVSNIFKGGREEGLKLLYKAPENYEEIRDYPFLETSKLSPHLKFGTISIREAYWYIADKFTKYHGLIRQFYWRDFFYNIADNFPYVFGHSFRKKYDNIFWENDEKKFYAWCNGKTGFPIVDAGMKELNETGYMHNRIRMIVASFLTKDLHIDWRWGEKYFAKKLIDYDPSINNGNWQWASSTGCDTQPYFRIFNPWQQQKKYDKDCIYIKKWLPELRDLRADDIHNLENKKSKFLDYPPPIVNHKIEAKKTLDYFKKI